MIIKMYPDILYLVIIITLSHFALPNGGQPNSPLWLACSAGRTCDLVPPGDLEVCGCDLILFYILLIL